MPSKGRRQDAHQVGKDAATTTTTGALRGFIEGAALPPGAQERHRLLARRWRRSKRRRCRGRYIHMISVEEKHRSFRPVALRHGK